MTTIGNLTIGEFADLYAFNLAALGFPDHPLRFDTPFHVLVCNRNPAYAPYSVCIILNGNTVWVDPTWFHAPVSREVLEQVRYMASEARPQEAYTTLADILNLLEDM